MYIQLLDMVSKSGPNSNGVWRDLFQEIVSMIAAYDLNPS